jgi:hypothetical protein
MSEQDRDVTEERIPEQGEEAEDVELHGGGKPGLGGGATMPVQPPAEE